MSKNFLVIIGGGGHAKVILDLIRQCNDYKAVGFTAPNQNSPLSESGLKYFGDDTCLPELFRQGITNAVMGFADINNTLRQEKFETIRKWGFAFPPLVHPSATLANNVVINDGTIVMAKAVVNAGTIIDTNVIINTGAIVEHDCILENSAQIGPGAILCGGVIVGKKAFIGAGACVIPQKRVGSSAVIGAGSIVLHDVKDNTTVFGNPATEKKHS